MKNWLLFLSALCIVTINSCTKCYNCHNLCKTCSEHHLTSNGDTTITIIVRSEVLGMQYFNEYIDSLTSPSLGWVCGDTASNYQERFCTSPSQKQVDLINKKDAGLICAGE